MRSETAKRESGVALVTTMIVVAVLAVVAVAFMQSTSTDRLSSRTGKNFMNARLVAEAGLAAATASIARSMTNDAFVVVANPTNRQLFVGNGVSGSTNISYTPAFSVVGNPGAVLAPIDTAGVPSTNVSGGAVYTNIMPGGLAVTSPPVAWVYLTNSDGTTNGRFVYWVEDLSGRIDLTVAGATNASDITNARRLTGTNAAELALWSLFSPGSPSDPGNAVSTKLASARSNIPTTATGRLVDQSMTPAIMGDLAAGLTHDTNEVEIIPFGFVYADEGKPKNNINTNISTAGVNAIADVIEKNLPLFAQRAGGYTNSAGGGATNANAYTPRSYLQTIAANIVDYADTNSDPTTDGTAIPTGRVRPVFRGVDSHPFVNEIAKRYRLISNVLTTQSGTSGRALVIETTDFFELWNPSSQTAQGNFVFVSAHRQGLSAGFLNTTFAAPTWASNNLGAVAGGVTTNSFNALNIPPNGFAVFGCSPVTNFFFVPSTNQIATVRVLQELTDSAYFSQWNGAYYDAALGGILRLEIGNLTAAPTNRGNLPSFIYRINANSFADPAVGDPRATIYLSLPADATAYDTRSSFGGRNDRRITGEPYGQVSPSTWPDSGHDSPPGNPAGSHATAPTNVPTAAYSNVPPVRISNSGAFSNIVELGAVFDPIQWRVASLNAWQGKWTNLATDASPTNAFGGGNSLRIGRAEHPRFTNDGLRAAQLLDLFAAGPVNSSGLVVRRVPGRININTATTNALRALAAGVYNSRDSALRPGGTNYVISTNAVRAFVQGVTNFRTSRPFLSVNQLPSIGTNNTASQWPTNAVFGNTNAASAGVAAWNDAAAEEWFAKIHSLSTVRSRNFLIHVVSQALATNNPANVLSTFRLAAQVYFPPVRDNQGLATNSRSSVLLRWDL
jgi:hypothetical protein